MPRRTRAIFTDPSDLLSKLFRNCLAVMPAKSRWDGTVAFVMRERLTHHNVTQNAYVAYLFIEEGFALGGVRLSLRKHKEEPDHALIASASAPGCPFRAS